MPKPVSDPVAVDLLLTHARWVEGFARALVRDDADDVAQDSWLAAIQHPPQPAASHRPWLATVMRNVARMRFRSAARRRAREDLAGLATSSSIASPADLAERMELQRRLAAAVLALAEPQRSTIVLVFYEGLSPAEVGRQLGVPATTVRSRVRAALVALRADLDAQEAGDRSRWKLALAPLVGFTVPKAPLLPFAAAFVAAAACTAIVIAVAPRTSESAPSPALVPPAATSSPIAAASAPVTTAPALAVDDPWGTLHEDEDAEDAPPPPTTTPAFMRAHSTLLAHVDECYELARKAGRDVRGTVQLSLSLRTRPQVRAEVVIDRKGTTITDAETLECVRENATAIEDHVERLRADGETVEGPITIHVKRAMPPPPKAKPAGWPEDSASPDCPPGTHLVGTPRDPDQWCEEGSGTKHGPWFHRDKQGRLVLHSAYEHGQLINSLQMRDPDSE